MRLDVLSHSETYFRGIFMKYVLTILFFAQLGFATEVATSTAINEKAVVVEEGINFESWESEFDSSMKKAKIKVRKCEAQSKNCQFEKFQALDPSFDMVH